MVSLGTLLEGTVSQIFNLRLSFYLRIDYCDAGAFCGAPF